MLISALLAAFALGIDLNDPAPPPKHAISAHNAPESGNLAAEMADLRREVAEIKDLAAKSLGNAIKIELLGREIADLRDSVQKSAVRTPPAPARPKLWYLTDSSGKEWQDIDPENLKRWVRQKNQAAATPKFTAYRTYDELAFPPQSTAAFQPAPPPPMTPMAVAPAPPTYYAMPPYGGSYGSIPSMGLGGGILGGSFLGGGSCVGGSCR